MNILENELEEIIYKYLNEEPYLIYERGLTLAGMGHGPVILRQFNLGSYGIMDIVLVAYDRLNREFIVNAVELKKDAINLQTVDQGIRYKKGIEHFVSTYYPSVDVSVKITLIGKKIDFNSNVCYLPDSMPCLGLFTYEIDLVKGLNFKAHSGYQLTTPSFKPPSEEFTSKIKDSFMEEVRRYTNV